MDLNSVALFQVFHIWFVVAVFILVFKAFYEPLTSHKFLCVYLYPRQSRDMSNGISLFLIKTVQVDFMKAAGFASKLPSFGLQGFWSDGPNRRFEQRDNSTNQNVT